MLSAVAGTFPRALPIMEDGLDDTNRNPPHLIDPAEFQSVFFKITVKALCVPMLSRKFEELKVGSQLTRFNVV